MNKLSKIALGAAPLTLEEIEAVACHNAEVILSQKAIDRILSSHQFLQENLKLKKTIYGINTGFGLLSSVKIDSQKIQTLQLNLIRSHAVGMGKPYPKEVARAMLILRANALAVGHSGVRLQVVEQILSLLNHQITPVIPEQGSVGASGDLAPLAHLALVLIGEGKAWFGGKQITGSEALKKAGLSPLVLGPKEGLALINGTQAMTAQGILTLLKAERLCDLADLTGAMSLEAFRGTVDAFEAPIHRVRLHPGQIQVAANIRRMLASEESKSQIAQSHKDCGKVQDPYSFRCIPQVHGTSRDALQYVRGVLEREANAVTDNPLLFAEENQVLSGGNFHGQAVSMAMDFLSIAVAELASISEQRFEKLVNPVLSELPAFLIRDSGINSGFMMIQVTAAAIVSENKTLCHPACVDTIPTSADKEDHVSMGVWASRKAAQVLENSLKVISLELFAACQGVDLLRPLKSTPILEEFHQMIRDVVPFVKEDRVFHDDFEPLLSLVSSEKFSSKLRHFLQTA